MFDISSTDYQLPISDYESDSENELEWLHSKDHLSVLDEVFKWKHERVHNDYYAMLLPRSDIPFVIHHTCSITVQKSRRYCVTLPEQRKSFSVPDLYCITTISLKGHLHAVNINVISPTSTTTKYL